MMKSIWPRRILQSSFFHFTPTYASSLEELTSQSLRSLWLRMLVVKSQIFYVNYCRFTAFFSYPAAYLHLDQNGALAYIQSLNRQPLTDSSVVAYYS